jgi:D-arginine dehydrogenase
MSSTAPSSTVHADFIVIGGGIAGASAAHGLAPFGRVVLLERESQPGYHSTGRSAALFMPSYGGPQVRALTLASRAFFESALAGLCPRPVLAPRGAMTVATRAQEAQLDGHWRTLREVSPHSRRLTVAQARTLCSALRPEALIGAVYEPDALDMDVHEIHQGYLRGLRRAGGSLVCQAQVAALDRGGGLWQVRTADAHYSAPVVLNAAGAWADDVAALAGVAPLGLQPRRRSAFLFAPPTGLDVGRWPLVIGAQEDWYLKPDAGLLLGSPANADPVPPQDVQPEELDIASAIDRIESMTTLTIRRPQRTWAGLRSFVPDGALVAGFDDAVPGFFWVAGQGGYGIQTSAAMGAACAALARSLPLPGALTDYGLTEQMLSPARLRQAPA